WASFDAAAKETKKAKAATKESSEKGNDDGEDKSDFGFYFRTVQFDEGTAEVMGAVTGYKYRQYSLPRIVHYLEDENGGDDYSYDKKHC
ncbi:MAG: hypothetical protein ACRCUT_04285, partial [Spirochaetota bacterium]